MNLGKKGTILICLGIAATILVGTYWFSKPKDLWSQPVTAETITRGAKLFQANCAACHGSGGIGERAETPKGGMKDDGSYIAPALNGKGHAWHHPNSMLFQTVKKGSIAEDSSMRAFEGRLSDEEIVTIIHYFQSFWPQEVLERRAQRTP